MKRILIFILIVLVFATSIDIVNAQFLNNEVKDKKLIDIQGLETLSVDNLDQEVVFEDEDLKKQIMEKLNIDENIKIKDMSNIEEITLTDISSLVGLEHASNLQILDIMNSELNLDVIVNLSNLEILKLSNCEANFFDISQAINLKELAIENCSLVEISFITGLQNLEILSLKDNYISDTMPLINLTNLNKLNLENNYLISLLDILTLSDLGAFTSTGSAINLDNNYLDVSPNSFNCFYFDMLDQKGIEVRYNNQNIVEEISEIVIEKENVLYKMNLERYIHAKAFENFVYDMDQGHLLEIKYLKGNNNYYDYSDYLDLKESLGSHVYKALGYLNDNNRSVNINCNPFNFE